MCKYNRHSKCTGLLRRFLTLTLAGPSGSLLAPTGTLALPTQPAWKAALVRRGLASSQNGSARARLAAAAPPDRLAAAAPSDLPVATPVRFLTGAVISRPLLHEAAASLLAASICGSVMFVYGVCPWCLSALSARDVRLQRLSVAPVRDVCQ